MIRKSTAIWVTLLMPAMVGMACPAAASAHRHATRTERTGMVYGASGRYYGGIAVAMPRSVPQRCFVAEISTVVRGSRWGAWTFSSYAYDPTHERQCRTGNGIAIEHRIQRRWYVLWEGSEGYPPTHRTKSGSLILQAVPRAVAKDLIAGLR